MRIHHVGYLVEDIAAAEKAMEALGFVGEYPGRVDPSRQIHVRFMRNGALRVELIQPVDAASPVAGLLRKHRNSPYHFCYATDDLDGRVEALRADGYMTLHPPGAAPAIQGTARVAFLVHPDIGLIELVEGAEE